MNLYIKTDKVLGKEIRKAREELKIPQESVCKQLGISQSALSKIERGRQPIFVKYETLKRVFPGLVA